MPKSMGTKIPRTATVLSWQTGPEQPRRPRVVQETPAGASYERSQRPAAVLVLAAAGAAHGGAAAPVQAVQVVPEARSEVVTMTVMMMTPTSVERLVKVDHQSGWWLARNPARRV